MSVYTQSIEFTHDGKDYVADVDCNPDLAPRMGWITDQETGNRVYSSFDTDGWHRRPQVENPDFREIEKAAWNAFDSHCERGYERQQARLMSDPPESYESAQRKNRALK